MFFDKHPHISISDNNGNSKTVTDIAASLVVGEFYKNSDYSVPYNIQDSDTPESLAARMYNDPKLSWVILLVNNIKNIYTEWPLSTNSFSSLIEYKYSYRTCLFLRLETVKEYNILPGNIIVVYDDLNPNYVNTTNVAQVVEWDATFSKLTIKLLKGEFKIKNNISFYNTPNVKIGKIGRVVNSAQHAVHHFENSDVYLDPLYGSLQGYINNNSSDNVITSLDYETKINDDKRTIFLPTQTTVNLLVSQYNKVFNV